MSRDTGRLGGDQYRKDRGVASMSSRFWKVSVAVALLASLAMSRANAGTVSCVSSDEISSGNNLRLAIESAAAGETVLLESGCTYRITKDLRETYNTGILIAGKSGLSIIGQDQATSIIKIDRDVYIGLEIRSNTNNLLISNLTIAGGIEDKLCIDPALDNEEDACRTSIAGSNPGTHGIASRGGHLNISNVRIDRVVLKNLAVGISVGSAHGANCDVPNAYTNVVVSRNVVEDIRGKWGGSGYGIHLDCASDVRIRGNTVSRAQRHSIYIAKTAVDSTSPIVVASNVIIDPGHGPELWGVTAAALVLARSDNVTAIDNEIVGGHTYGISAEEDPQQNYRACTKCMLAGNKFLTLDTSLKDIWINNGSAAGPVLVWFNTKTQGPSAQIILPTPDSGSVFDVGASGRFWQGTQSIAYTSSDTSDTEGVFVMQGNVLHRVAPDWGENPESSWRNYKFSTTHWYSFFWLSAYNERVQVWQNSVLHQVTPQSSNSQWPYTYSTNWFAPAAMDTAPNGQMCVIQNGILHRVSPATWAYSYSVESWTNVEGVVATDGGCFVKAGSSIWLVVPGASGSVWPKTLVN